MSAAIALVVGLIQWILPGGLASVWRYVRDARPARKLVDPFARKSALLVYSTVVMKEYLARNERGVVIQQERGVHGEGVVSSYGDVLGYFQLVKLLTIAGIKEDAIDGKRCDEWVDQDWERNLILLGSPISNSKTEVALRGCGYHFNEDVGRVLSEAEPRQWVANDEFDYCIVAKRVNTDLDCSYIISAGLGPAGTQAGCHYLARRFRELVRRYADGPFAIVLKVDRRVGHTGWSEVDSVVDLTK